MEKFEIRPEVDGTGRNCPEWVSGTSTETFDTFPLKNYGPLIDFEKNIVDQKGVGYFWTARYVHKYMYE